MTEKSKTLKAFELTKIFPHASKEETNIPLFAGASFEMTSEQLNFIVGVSGSGKTTLFRIISSIEPINAGELFFNDLAIHRLKGKEKVNYLRTLSFMDQFPAKYLFLHLTVEQNLDYALTLYTSLKREERKEKILETANVSGIENLLERKALFLSGGELRRLSLACNIIYNPMLLLCDEPTAQLDDTNKDKVMDLIRKMNEHYETMIIIASHDRSIINNEPTYEISERRINQCP
ncbi:MAG: ATP-binding cassette domain-containing protein [Candidatus Heimdallarchaeota archaeon]